MNNFIYHNPTKLVFGKGQIARLPKLIPAGKRIMLTFGGGSVKRNGVYDQVVAALEGRDLVEFWGIEANPSVETLREAIALGKERKVDFLLAVGGGSVIDGTKLIAAGLLYDGDAWDIVLKGQAGKTVPLATVLTMSATGSEMNSGAVISRYETKEKYAFYGDYPVFSILDPETLYSLPKRQVACGLADTFVHVLEQYMTTPHQSRLMDRWAEGILHTVVEIALKALADERDYDTMSEYMLSATLALNDMIRMGVTQDWATHMIGHELTALHGLTHGATQVVLTNLDVLGYLDEIPVCVAYEVDGKQITEFPATPTLMRCKPVYVKLPGWKCDIRGVKSYDELPENCRKYVEFIENACGVPIKMVSNGPKRHEVLYR